MALISIKENIPGRSHTISKDDSTYTRVFRVVTDTIDDGPQTVRQYLANEKGIVYGVTYSAGNDADASSRVKTISPSPASDDGLHWDITVAYGRFDSESTSDSPLDEPTEFNYSFSQYEEPVERSINGFDVLNSASDPFAEAITRTRSRPVLSVARNEANFNPLLAVQYVGSINLDSFQGGEPGTVRCLNIGASLQYQEGFGNFWGVNYEFEFNPEGFDKVILDMGYRELVDGKLKPITVGGKAVSDPVLLDGQGKYAGPEATPHYKRFQIYPALPFSVFGI